MRGADAVLTRRCAASLLTAALAARPSPGWSAQGACSAATGTLAGALRTLDDIDGLLADAASWTEAAERLERESALRPSALQAAFDACVEPLTAKENWMEQNAVVVYYEERRYNDLRLEPQAPSRRAEQNGYKKEALRAIEDERAELRFLAKQPGGEDGADLRRYSADARRALRAFLAR